MKKIHLKDIDMSNGQEEEMGTCELCFWTAWCNNPVFVFELDSGEKVSIDGYWWDWGDYSEVPDVNIIDFAAWLEKQSFKNDIVFDQEWLIDTISDYLKVSDTGYKDSEGNIIYADSKVMVQVGNESQELTISVDEWGVDIFLNLPDHTFVDMEEPSNQKKYPMKVVETHKK